MFDAVANVYLLHPPKIPDATQKDVYKKMFRMFLNEKKNEKNMTISY